MPTADRAVAEGTAVVYFRCGSQTGKPALTVPANTTQPELDERTVDFLVGEISTYRQAVAGRQKNAARNLKKYLDADDIRRVEELGETDARAAALSLL